MARGDEPALGPKDVREDEVPGVAMEDIRGDVDHCSWEQNPENIRSGVRSMLEFVSVAAIGAYTGSNTSGFE